MAANDTGQGELGTSPAQVFEGIESEDQGETYPLANIPTSVPRSTTYQKSGTSSIFGGVIG